MTPPSRPAWVPDELYPFEDRYRCVAVDVQEDVLAEIVALISGWRSPEIRPTQPAWMRDRVAGSGRRPRSR